MAIDGNLTTLSITDSDLLARVPALTRMRDPRAADWAPQIAAGKSDALVAFQASRGDDPLFCKPVNVDAWKRVLVFYTLAIIFQPMLGAEYAGEFDKWFEMAEKALGRFQYVRDTDESGALDESEEDLVETVRSVRLLR